MELTFTGKITAIKDVKTGTSQQGKEWASATFEVTEIKDQYPQCALFDYFKNGDFLEMAKDFKNKFKVGETVTVYFNMKKNKYQKDGETRAFYKTSAWKIDKLSKDVPSPDQAFEPAGNLNVAEDDLPF